MMERKNNLKEIYKNIDNGDIQKKLSEVPLFPRIIEFEITNHCNFQCLMCKTGVGTCIRQRGYMQDEVFYKVLDEIEMKCPSVALKFVGQGEPMLHPEILRYLEEAKKRGIICHLTTNGSLLEIEGMQRIIDLEVDSVKFSFQGVDREGYYTLRRKDNFEILLNKISKLYKLRGNKQFPYITIGTSVTNEDNKVIEDFRKYCKTICDHLEVGITTLEFIESDKIADKNVREEILNLKQKQNKIKKRYKCCPQVFDVIAIRWNGDITACCADLDGVMTLGNIMDMSIEEAWNTERERGYREILARAEYEKLPLCKDCYDVYGWTYGDNNL